MKPVSAAQRIPNLLTILSFLLTRWSRVKWSAVRREQKIKINKSRDKLKSEWRRRHLRKKRWQWELEAQRTHKCIIITPGLNCVQSAMAVCDGGLIGVEDKLREQQERLTNVRALEVSLEEDPFPTSGDDKIVFTSHLTELTWWYSINIYLYIKVWLESREYPRSGSKMVTFIELTETFLCYCKATSHRKTQYSRLYFCIFVKKACQRHFWIKDIHICLPGMLKDCSCNHSYFMHGQQCSKSGCIPVPHLPLICCSVVAHFLKWLVQ